MGWPKGLHGREGDNIHWVVQVEGKESWWIGIFVGFINVGIGLCEDNG